MTSSVQQTAFPVQQTFGQFIAARVGPRWVYAQRNSDRIKSQYPGSAVILPKQQRELRADATLSLCSGKVPAYVEERRKETLAMVRSAIDALTTCTP